MPGVVTVILHGPNLEQLRHWGRLDSLPWSLDSDIWPEADLLGLRIDLPTPTKSGCRANVIYGSVRCRSVAGTSARATATADNIRMHSLMRVITSGCNAPVTHNAACRCVIYCNGACRGEKRGHNWVVVPVVEGIWTEREL